MPELKYVPLDKIRTNPVALRDVNRKDEQFIQLKDSIAARGVLLPINLRPKPDKDGKEYELVDGLQRFTASSEVGTGVVGEIGVIPAQIMEQEDADALVNQVIGNAHRIETKPAEYSRGLRRILGFYPTWTINELAAKLNKSPTWVDKQLSLNKLNGDIQKIVDEGKMQLVNAYALAQLPPEEQPVWLERAMSQPTEEFAQAATKRAKEIRDAARKGRSSEPEKFNAVSVLRPKGELEKLSALTDGKIPETSETAKELNRKYGISGKYKDKAQVAEAAIQLAFAFILNLDPDSIKMQEERWNARKKSEAEAKIRRDAEKKAAKEKEAQERAAQASKDAAAAKAAADALPKEEPVTA